MKVYELTYIASPNISIEEAENKLKELESKIQEKEGVILKSDKPVAKTLAYRIKKSNSGYFSVIEFQAEPEVIESIEKYLKDSTDLLRYMFLVKNPERKYKERRQRIKKPVEVVIKETKEIKEEVKETEGAKETEKIETTAKPIEEKKTTKKASKKKEKADIEDIDKELDEILSE